MYKENASLLDDICRITGCAYLSDLAEEEMRYAVSEAVKNINPIDYSLPQWQEAVSYILRNNIAISSDVEAKNLIVNF